ncbi:MAG TPA: type II toxin-antitoxin system HicA family toxin [Methylomirabilota bacterium]|nr:type II toxin-antitoxin system HicA family toxin [Methylomirabilota bacterium]
MKIPRDCTGPELARALGKFGYTIERQTGSHMIMTSTHSGQHHVTVPNHRPIKVGTLQSVLKVVAQHHKMPIEQLLRELGL